MLTGCSGLDANGWFGTYIVVVVGVLKPTLLDRLKLNEFMSIFLYILCLLIKPQLDPSWYSASYYRARLLPEISL